MFSSRFRWSFEPNRLARALEARRREGGEILDLTESNPTRAGFSYPADILRAFQDERLLQYEPDPAGIWQAREAIQRYYAERGVAVGPERILLTASTSEAYAYLFKLLTDPGDNVLVPRPSYPLFEFLAAMESVEVRTYALTYDGRWSLDPESLTHAINPRTRAIVVVNPNNPTGSYLKRADLEWLLAICKAREIALISDEVFADYAFCADPDRVRSLAAVEGGLAFSLSGLSKIAALPQMKLGWIVVSGGAARHGAWQRLEWIADTYLSVGAPVQCAAERLLKAGTALQEQIATRTSQNLRLARQALAGTAASLLNLEGGWYAILQMPRTRTEEQWALDLLIQCGVLVQPGFFYDFETEAYLIVSLLTASSTFGEGIMRLKRFLDCA